MTYEVQEFIKDNIDLIEDNRWDQVYDNASFTLDSDSQGQLTIALLKANIDPVGTGLIDYIPEYYLSGAHIKTYDIPYTVHSLDEGCFSYSDIETITLPPSVSSIGPYVFYDCAMLRRVVVLGDIQEIGAGVFQGCFNPIIVCKKDSVMYKYALVNNMEIELI